MTGRFVDKNTPLRRILIILLFIILLPALFFSAYELSTLGEYEELIAEVYEQQLETILFSVNQYAWDFVNTWISKIQNSLTFGNKNITKKSIQQLLETNAAIAYVSISDTLLMTPEIYHRGNIVGFITPELADLKNRQPIIEKLLKLSQQGYRKIETITDGNSRDSTLTIFYLQPIGDKQKILVAIVIQPEVFITDVLGPKLEDIAGTQFLVGVFDKKNKQFLYSNANLNFAEFKQTKKLWLFPDYLLGISLSGQSIEDLAHSRFYNSLILIGVLNLLIIIGGWILIRNIRREMQLARLKSDFVSNVSHELRTPLALIRLYAETLEMDRVKSDEKRQEYYRIINQESKRLTRLINNILNFSRIDSGQKEYKFSAVDINQVTKSVLEMYSYHIEQEGFVLNTELDKQIPLVLADPESVSEALINLIDNAVKYSQDEKEIAVRTGLSDGSVFLEVQDKGIGIDQKHQEVIFDKFYRISSALVHDTKGSGLGLSLIKHIMKSHGGNIRVQSEVGKGSTFRLLFHISKTEG
jgi:two-component system phosphate regulon sensor histidine kinase PhoR